MATPSQIPGYNVVRTIVSEDGKFRLEFYRRTDGSYGYKELTWAEEGAWIPRGGQRSIGFFGSEDEAMAEARQRVDWLQSE